MNRIALRTVAEAERLQKKLIRDYEAEYRRRPSENMGNKYMEKFEEFIGDVWDYGYFERQKVQALRKELFDAVTLPPKTASINKMAVAKELVSIAKMLDGKSSSSRIALGEVGLNVKHYLGEQLDDVLVLRNNSTGDVRSAWNDVATSLGRTMHLVEVAVLKQRNF